jgi:hypothetical protein
MPKTTHLGGYARSTETLFKPVEDNITKIIKPKKIKKRLRPIKFTGKYCNNALS